MNTQRDLQPPALNKPGEGFPGSLQHAVRCFPRSTSATSTEALKEHVRVALTSPSP